MKEYIKEHKADDAELMNVEFAQGDVVTTLITWRKWGDYHADAGYHTAKILFQRILCAGNKGNVHGR